MRKRLLAAGLIGALVLPLAACGPSFKETCEEQNGEVFTDTMQEWVSTTVSGTIFVDGKSVSGSGLYSGMVTLTVEVCTRDGRILEVNVS